MVFDHCKKFTDSGLDLLLEGLAIQESVQEIKVSFWQTKLTEPAFQRFLLLMNELPLIESLSIRTRKSHCSTKSLNSNKFKLIYAHAHMKIWRLQATVAEEKREKVETEQRILKMELEGEVDQMEVLRLSKGLSIRDF